MANMLPGPDGPGLFEHPLYGVLETHQVKNPFDEDGDSVFWRYSNGSLCLVQTALGNNNSLQFLKELIWAVAPHNLLYRCIALDCYPSEYLLLADMMSIEQWSLVLGQARPEIVALCLSHLYNRELYANWLYSMPDPKAATDPLFAMIQAQICESVDKLIIGYATVLATVMLTGDESLDKIPSLGLLQMLYLAQHQRLDLTALFKLEHSLKKFVCMWQVARMHIYQVGLLHMASFHPEELEKLFAKLGAIINPELPRADTALYQKQALVANKVIADYVEGLLAELKPEVEPDFTEADFKALFNL